MAMTLLQVLANCVGVVNCGDCGVVVGGGANKEYEIDKQNDKNKLLKI